MINLRKVTSWYHCGNEYDFQQEIMRNKLMQFLNLLNICLNILFDLDGHKAMQLSRKHMIKQQNILILKLIRGFKYGKMANKKTLEEDILDVLIMIKDTNEC